jgi:hypothetical protein
MKTVGRKTRRAGGAPCDTNPREAPFDVRKIARIYAEIADEDRRLSEVFLRIAPPPPPFDEGPRLRRRRRGRNGARSN